MIVEISVIQQLTDSRNRPQLQISCDCGKDF
jgi:hypothetical protein